MYMHDCSALELYPLVNHYHRNDAETTTAVTLFLMLVRPKFPTHFLLSTIITIWYKWLLIKTGSTTFINRIIVVCRSWFIYCYTVSWVGTTWFFGPLTMMWLTFFVTVLLQIQRIEIHWDGGDSSDTYWLTWLNKVMVLVCFSVVEG